MASGTLCLLTIMAYHVWSSSRPPQATSQWQLARIDFEEPIDDGLTANVKQLIRRSGPVHHVHINSSKTSAVFAYTPGYLAPEGVATNIKRGLGINASTYQVSPERIAAGCPITGKTGMLTKVKNFFQL